VINIEKTCKECGKKFIAHSNRRLYCDKCKDTIVKNRWDNNRTKNAICEYCGKPYYRRETDMNMKNKCCSNECKLRLWHKQGIKIYWKAYAEENNINDFNDWLINEHWGKGKTLKEISVETGMNRTVITRLIDKTNKGHRNISQDNYRRYATMTKGEIAKQTELAHKKAKYLWDNDTKWRESHIKNIMEAQNYRESSIEVKIKNELDRRGLKYKSQYQICSWFIDITFPEKKLAVEIDGDYWHSLPKQIQKDANKDHWLIRHHWKILRLKEHEIKANVNSCADRIEALLK
jgi:very-short-patch-repair endonuclease/ribosomal protein S27AE